MSLLRRPSFWRYVVGLVATFTGAWLTDVTGSTLPLALGASALLMFTVSLVREIWTRPRNKR